MDAYATASGGVIFVQATIKRKKVNAAPVSYSHIAKEDKNFMREALPLTAPDYSVSVELLKTA